MGAVRADPADLRGQVDDHIRAGVAKHALDVGEPPEIVVTAPGDDHVAAPTRLERVDDARAEKAGTARHEDAPVVPEAAPGRRAHPMPPVLPAAAGGEAS